MAEIAGHRVENHDAFWASPAVWWKWHLDGGTCWMVRPPCGHHFMIGRADWNPRHEIDEHDDGAITVEPKPTNSNSILCPECGWHGYIHHGVWTT